MAKMSRPYTRNMLQGNQICWNLRQHQIVSGHRALENIPILLTHLPVIQSSSGGGGYREGNGSSAAKHRRSSGLSDTGRSGENIKT